MTADNITRRHCSSCDEWTMVPCRDCGHTARICCLKVTASDWTGQLILRSNDHPTDCDATNGEKNTCGDFGLVVSPCVNFQVQWFPDGGVSCKKIFVSISGTVAGDSNTISHSFYGTPDWYLTPITWTQSGRTYTVEVCEEGDEGIDYTAADSVILKGVNIVDGTPPTLTNGFGSGDRLCGTFLICGVPLENEEGQTTCYLDGATTECYAVEWSYSILTDLVTVEWGTVSGGSFTAIETWFTALYGTGTWVDPEPSHTIWWETTDTGQRVVGRVTGCDDDWSGYCEPYDCYPLCVVNTCPDDPPDTVNAVSPTLTWDGTDIGHFEYSLEEGWSFVLTDPFSGWEAQLYCTTPGVPADGQTLFIDPPIEWDGPTSWVIHMSCTGGTMNDVIIEVSVPPETVVITLTV